MAKLNAIPILLIRFSPMNFSISGLLRIHFSLQLSFGGAGGAGVTF